MPTLVSIETTPNPNSMKLNLNETIGITETFSHANQASAPMVIQKLLQIEGVQSVFVTASFLTLNRDPRVDWQSILATVQKIFADTGGQTASLESESLLTPQKQEQVQVLVQTFRGIPIQVKVTDGVSEERVGLPPRFGETARELQAHFGVDYLNERHWADWGVRYGALSEVAQNIAEELEGVMDPATLDQQKRLALGEAVLIEVPQKVDNASLVLSEPNWEKRLRILQELEASESVLPLLTQALKDEKPLIRRWAAAKLGTVKHLQSIAALSEALLNDPNAGVRRTSGDSLSDIGDVSAQPAVCKALSDENKLVRWRAARFLAEVGTEAALPFLEKALQDAEYEVRLEVEAAIQRIQTGSKATMPAWKLISQGIDP